MLLIIFLFSYGIKLIRYWKNIKNDYYREILVANLSYLISFMIFNLSHDSINYRFFYVTVFIGASIVELIRQGKIE